ncbi:unnamed protein product [Effrenium voratum]|nr:unnamed protein product [Effrenium voratum]
MACKHLEMEAEEVVLVRPRGPVGHKRHQVGFTATPSLALSERPRAPQVCTKVSRAEAQEECERLRVDLAKAVQQIDWLSQEMLRLRQDLEEEQTRRDAAERQCDEAVCQRDEARYQRDIALDQQEELVRLLEKKSMQLEDKLRATPEVRGPEASPDESKELCSPWLLNRSVRRRNGGLSQNVTPKSARRTLGSISASPAESLSIAESLVQEMFASPSESFGLQLEEKLVKYAKGRKLRESDSPLFALNGLLAEKKRRGDSVVLSTCTNSPDVEELATAMGSPSWWA